MRLLRRHPHVANLALLGASLAGALALAELVLREVERRAGHTTRFQVFVDSTTSPCLVKPDLRLSIPLEGREAIVETNSRGLRWREVDTRKESGTRRVAIMGDSFTFGEWARSTEDTFAGVVDSELGGSDLEFINFGVPSDGFAQIRWRLEHEVLAYDPDVLLLMSFNGNDILDTYLGLDKQDCASGELRSSVLRDKIPSAYRTPFRRAMVTKLDRYSALVRSLRRVKGRLTGDVRFIAPGDVALPLAPFHPADDPLASTFWSKTELPPVGAAARDETVRVLGDIFDVAQARGIAVILVSIPFRGQIYAAQSEGPGYDIALPQEYLAELAHSRDVAYYDLLPDLRQYVTSCAEVLFIQGDPHPNTHGHRVIGELLSRFLAAPLGVEVTMESLGCLGDPLPSAAGAGGA